MRGWLVLTVTLAVGVALGIGVATKGRELVGSYLPGPMLRGNERIEAKVVRKLRDGNRLLMKVNTAEGPKLLVFTEKSADLDVLLDPGDTVTLTAKGHGTFLEDPILDKVMDGGSAKAPGSLPASPSGSPSASGSQ